MSEQTVWILHRIDDCGDSEILGVYGSESAARLAAEAASLREREPFILSESVRREWEGNTLTTKWHEDDKGSDPPWEYDSHEHHELTRWEVQA